MKPNIIYILADDLGYGDVACNHPGSKIPTPNLDRLAAEGMRFTDAHACSSVCTPSRYSILTGRYCWRSPLKAGIVWQWDAPLIEAGRLTVAELLRQQGYHTACLGKWHLGWDWQMTNGARPNDSVPLGVHGGEIRAELNPLIDLAAPIGGGPVERGFDTYFGIDIPNFPPYAWFENDHLVAVPSVEKPAHLYGHAGPAVPDWDHHKMIPEFTRRAVELIEARADEAEPFFLYFALTSPHSPVVPNEAFRGKSGAGNYGDFVCEVDWVVGQVCDALKRSGLEENTLVIFTSDNGPEDRTKDDEGVYQRARDFGHFGMGDLRGIKRDVWEGGHRVPFIARWPGVTPPGSVCGQLVGLGDFLATCADITRTSLSPGEAEDSTSFLPLLEGRMDEPTRECLVHHSASGKFAIRRGDWVFIDAPHGGDNAEPEWYRESRGYEPHDFPAELFHLGDDPSERVNRYADHPEVVEELSALLREIQAMGSDPDQRDKAALQGGLFATE